MKLVAWLAFFIMPFCAVAQSLTAGIQGGVLYNTAPKPATATAVKSYGSVRLYKPLNDVELGFCLDIGSLDANTTVQFIDSFTKKLEVIAYTEQYARTFIMPNLSVNSRTPLKFGSWYFGGNIGYMIGRTTFMETHDLYTVVKRNETTSGASVGVHTGLSINAGSRLGFNIEAAGRFASIGRNRPKIFYFPLSAGLQYAF
ncbi:MAG: hypothetical protein K0R82_612 [Flavipsychrobacter sp.]|jgi:hypothetical protein|nr:hypothetical protein [Flavipsychrobacter sp.]